MDGSTNRLNTAGKRINEKVHQKRVSRLKLEETKYGKNRREGAWKIELN